MCRPARAVRLNLPGGRRFETEAPRTPILFGSGFTILAGETVMVEGVIRDNALVDLVAVPEVTHPERTIVFELSQESSIGDGTGMVLKARSPFPGTLKYRLGMMYPEVPAS